jgi:hypothetical protein
VEAQLSGGRLSAFGFPSGIWHKPDTGTSENSVLAKFTFGAYTKDEARRSGPQVAGRITIIPNFVRMQAVTSVQQPCRNPSKSPEN